MNEYEDNTSEYLFGIGLVLIIIGILVAVLLSLVVGLVAGAIGAVLFFVGAFGMVNEPIE